MFPTIQSVSPTKLYAWSVVALAVALMMGSTTFFGTVEFAFGTIVFWAALLAIAELFS